MGRRLFARLLPDPQRVKGNRWIAWLGPAILHPDLWHLSRRGAARGMAIGVFWGFLVPVAQIPLSAVCAVLLRGNLPLAMVSTLVTNPFTFPPVYVFAYWLGSLLIGAVAPEAAVIAAEAGAVAAPQDAGWWSRTYEAIAALGKPLLVGLPILAVAGAATVYFGVSLVWRWYVMRSWRRRQRRAGR
jgi:uncharacterized protein (DUF2062 family)